MYFHLPTEFYDPCNKLALRKRGLTTDFADDTDAKRGKHLAFICVHLRSSAVKKKSRKDLLTVLEYILDDR